MRRRGWIAVVAVALGVAAVLGNGVRRSSGSHGRLRLARSTRGQRRREMAVADRVAGVAGDGHPTKIVTVSTTLAAAEHVVAPGGRGEGGPQPRSRVRVFVMRGDFAAPHGLPHRHPPRGTSLVVVIDAASGREVLLTLGEQSPNLRRLGTEQTLVEHGRPVG
ncbi:MAG: hypothetical protein ACYCST_21430 [Acidimicrobiales bacterium]